jgi:hypothetical protein
MRICVKYRYRYLTYDIVTLISVKFILGIGTGHVSAINSHTWIKSCQTNQPIKLHHHRLHHPWQLRLSLKGVFLKINYLTFY